MDPSSHITGPRQTTTKTVNCIEHRTKLFNEIILTYPIRKQLFNHLSAFSVSKFIYAAKLDDVARDTEKEYFLNPLRDLFTDAELSDLQGIVSDELAIVVWGKDLKHLFDRVKDPMRYGTDSRKLQVAITPMYSTGTTSSTDCELPGTWFSNPAKCFPKIKTNTPDCTARLTHLCMTDYDEGKALLILDPDYAYADIVTFFDYRYTREGFTLTGAPLPYVSVRQQELRLRQCHPEVGSWTALMNLVADQTGHTRDGSCAIYVSTFHHGSMVYTLRVRERGDQGWDDKLHKTPAVK